MCIDFKVWQPTFNILTFQALLGSHLIWYAQQIGMSIKFLAFVRDTALTCIHALCALLETCQFNLLSCYLPYIVKLQYGADLIIE